MDSLALDALPVLFARLKLEELLDHDKVEAFPIKFLLLCDRGSQHLLKMKYNEQNESTIKVAKQWEISLLKWTNICGQYCHEFEACASPVVCLTISK